MAQDPRTIAEIKSIAEEAYLYGFPMIVGYDVLYKFFIDRNAGQFKAPINHLHNERARLHPQGHRDQHAQQRHTLLHGTA